ncbi:hypothetical protein C8J56DRAFT_890686 [Mycena floridula]|nr:hypothetical protein C8J56DRAFT_890686 [Mycena floridula]
MCSGIIYILFIVLYFVADQGLDATHDMSGAGQACSLGFHGRDIVLDRVNVRASTIGTAYYCFNIQRMAISYVARFNVPTTDTTGAGQAHLFFGQDTTLDMSHGLQKMLAWRKEP